MLRRALLTLGVAVVLSACHRIDDDRVPIAPVNIEFATIAQWNVYGVAGAMDYKEFIREERKPRNFPWLASTYTGFGGVIILTDVMGEFRAFDLACPVECRRDVRIEIEEETMLARCPVCQSAYNVFSLYGYPVEGRAAENGWGLRRYNIGPSRGATSYMLVTF